MTDLHTAAKQALEALEDANTELEYLNDPKGFVSMRQERIMEKARKAITALRQALANEALDKMADNAKEVRLDYELAQQEKAPPEQWSERWYGSGSERGWWIVCGREHIAHLGPSEFAEVAASKLVDAHNRYKPAPQNKEPALKAAPLSDYEKADADFHKWWYSHMKNDLMQPPLNGVGYRVARYIWDAAMREAQTEQPAQVADPRKQEPKQSEIFCGVDFADGMLSVSVLRRREDDVAELLHLEQIELPSQQEPVGEVLNERGEVDWISFVPTAGTSLYLRPQARKPQFREFIKWAGAQGYDCAQTCNSDTGEWICLNPMTADLWKAWQAAHGVTGDA